MKIYPINTIPKNTFKSRLPQAVKPQSNSKQFFEAVGVVGLTSIPMFIYLYLHWLYQKVFGDKDTKK